MKTGSLKDILKKEAEIAKPKCKHFFKRGEDRVWTCVNCNKTTWEIWKK